MGLDVSANIIVGVPMEEAYRRTTITRNVSQTDINGINYTLQEKCPVIIFLGKEYKDVDNTPYGDLMEENGLQEINERIIGIVIFRTESHRHSDQPITIIQDDLNKKINEAMEKMRSFELNPRIYLIQDISF